MSNNETIIIAFLYVIMKSDFSIIKSGFIVLSEAVHSRTIAEA